MMMSKTLKRVLFLMMVYILPAAVFAADKKVIIEINNVKPAHGTVFVSVYDSAESYRAKKPFRQMKMESVSAQLSIKESLPDGDYLVSVYQDLNGNGKLDSNFIGVPIEPIGISNYSGKGIPGGFDKLKVQVKADGTTIKVGLVDL
jgi:uncharacterized protein (DUF2141 family)